MRAGTEYWVGIRHVGARADPDQIQNLEAREIARLIAKTIAETSLAQRIDIVIARTEDEVLNRLNTRQGSGTGSRTQTDSFNIDNFFNPEDF